MNNQTIRKANIRSIVANENPKTFQFIFCSALGFWPDLSAIRVALSNSASEPKQDTGRKCQRSAVVFKSRPVGWSKTEATSSHARCVVSPWEEEIRTPSLDTTPLKETGLNC